MQLGVFTPVFQELSLPEMLVALRSFSDVEALELGAGGWPGASHLDVDTLLVSATARAELRSQLRDAVLTISALSCHGNALHPVRAIAERDDAIFRRTLQLAELLEVATVVTFSGCPGGGEYDVTPNWIVTAWPPECAAALRWQWEQRLIPHWRQAERLAAQHGVRVALEAHPGFMVYNPETLLQLRAATGTYLGLNLDPSHLWWQGVDVVAAIHALGDAIFHVHAKDVAMNPRALAVTGVLDAKPYTQMAERAWSFRSVGWGHDELTWKQTVSALRLAGYDGVLSIEHEDALASRDEGLRSAVAMLSRVLLREPPVEAWWA